MPTPSSDEIVDASRQPHTTCPPDDERASTWRTSEMDVEIQDDSPTAIVIDETASLRFEVPDEVGLTESHPNNDQQLKKMDIDEEIPSKDSMSPVSM